MCMTGLSVSMTCQLFRDGDSTLKCLTHPVLVQIPRLIRYDKCCVIKDEHQKTSSNQASDLGVSNMTSNGSHRKSRHLESSETSLETTWLEYEVVSRVSPDHLVSSTSVHYSADVAQSVAHLRYVNSCSWLGSDKSLRKNDFFQRSCLVELFCLKDQRMLWEEHTLFLECTHESRMKDENPYKVEILVWILIFFEKRRFRVHIQTIWYVASTGPQDNLKKM